MKWKQIVVYFVILVAVAGYYFIETAHKRKIKEQELESKKILNVKKDTITEIKLARKGEKPIIISKEKSGWIIKEPVKTDVDTFSLDNLLNSLVNVKAEKKLPFEKQQLSKFGLDKPRLTLTFSADKKWITVRVGDQNPTADRYYVTVNGKKQIHLIANFQWSALNKSLFDLRDKRLFTVKSDQVDRMEIARDSKIIKLVKNKDKWSSPDNTEIPIKKDKVEQLIDSLTWLRARKFVENSEEKLEEYGLKEPHIQIVLAIQKNKSQTLLLGKKKEKGQVYAKIASKPWVVLVSNSILNELPKDITDLEDKNILSFDEESVQKIHMGMLEGSYTLVREKEKWVWEGKNKPGKKPDTLKVSALLWKLKEIEHTGKTSKIMPQKERIEGTISLFDKDGKEIDSVKWEKELPGKKQGKRIFWVKKTDETKYKPFFIEKEDYKSLKEKLDDLIGKKKS